MSYIHKLHKKLKFSEFYLQSYICIYITTLDYTCQENQNKT